MTIPNFIMCCIVFIITCHMTVLFLLLNFDIIASIVHTEKNACPTKTEKWPTKTHYVRTI